MIAGIFCLIIITIDILPGNGQHIMIMNFVRPLTALYRGPLALLMYHAMGRKVSSKMREYYAMLHQTDQKFVDAIGEEIFYWHE
jgi:hypothetical protein